KRNVKVKLIESVNVGAGTTAISYAWINSHKKYPDSYHVLNLEGLKYWQNIIAPAVPESIKFNGHVEIASNEDHRFMLKTRFERLESLDYSARWLSSTELDALVPIKAQPEAIAAIFPWEGHAYPLELMRSLLNTMNHDPNFSLVHDKISNVALSNTSVRGIS